MKACGYARKNIISFQFAICIWFSCTIPFFSCNAFKSNLERNGFNSFQDNSDLSGKTSIVQNQQRNRFLRPGVFSAVSSGLLPSRSRYLLEGASSEQNTNVQELSRNPEQPGSEQSNDLQARLNSMISLKASKSTPSETHQGFELSDELSAQVDSMVSLSKKTKKKTAKKAAGLVTPKSGKKLSKKKLKNTALTAALPDFAYLQDPSMKSAVPSDASVAKVTELSLEDAWKKNTNEYSPASPAVPSLAQIWETTPYSEVADVGPFELGKMVNKSPEDSPGPVELGKLVNTPPVETIQAAVDASPFRSFSKNDAKTALTAAAPQDIAVSWKTYQESSPVTPPSSSQPSYIPDPSLPHQDLSNGWQLYQVDGKQLYWDPRTQQSRWITPPKAPTAFLPQPQHTTLQAVSVPKPVLVTGPVASVPVSQPAATTVADPSIQLHSNKYTQVSALENGNGKLLDNISGAILDKLSNEDTHVSTALAPAVGMQADSGWFDKMLSDSITPKSDSHTTMTASAPAPTQSDEWQAVPDANSGRTYYWNVHTNEVSWTNPSALDTPPSDSVPQPVVSEPAASASIAMVSTASDQSVELHPNKYKKLAVVEDGSTNLLDNISAVILDTLLNEDSSDQTEPAIGKQADSGWFDEMLSDSVTVKADTQSTVPSVSEQTTEEWQAVPDQNSGRTYYWNIHTNEVTWTKPASMDNTPAEQDVASSQLITQYSSQQVEEAAARFRSQLEQEDVTISSSSAVMPMVSSPEETVVSPQQTPNGALAGTVPALSTVPNLAAAPAVAALDILKQKILQKQNRDAGLLIPNMLGLPVSQPSTVQVANQPVTSATLSDIGYDLPDGWSEVPKDWDPLTLLMQTQVQESNDAGISDADASGSDLAKIMIQSLIGEESDTSDQDSQADSNPTDVAQDLSHSLLDEPPTLPELDATKSAAASKQLEPDSSSMLDLATNAIREMVLQESAKDAESIRLQLWGDSAPGQETEPLKVQVPQPLPTPPLMTLQQPPADFVKSLLETNLMEEEAPQLSTPPLTKHLAVDWSPGPLPFSYTKEDASLHEMDATAETEGPENVDLAKTLVQSIIGSLEADSGSIASKDTANIQETPSDDTSDLAKMLINSVIGDEEVPATGAVGGNESLLSVPSTDGNSAKLLLQSLVNGEDIPKPSLQQDNAAKLMLQSLMSGQQFPSQTLAIPTLPTTATEVLSEDADALHPNKYKKPVADHASPIVDVAISSAEASAGKSAVLTLLNSVQYVNQKAEPTLPPKAPSVTWLVEPEGFAPFKAPELNESEIQTHPSNETDEAEFSVASTADMLEETSSATENDDTTETRIAPDEDTLLTQDETSDLGVTANSQNTELLELPEETEDQDSSKQENFAQSLIHSLVGSLEEDVLSQVTEQVPTDPKVRAVYETAKKTEVPFEAEDDNELKTWANQLLGLPDIPPSEQNSEFLETPEKSADEGSSTEEDVAQSLIHSLVGSLEEDILSQIQETLDETADTDSSQNEFLAADLIQSLVGSLEEDVMMQDSVFLETPEETSDEDSSKNESLAKSLIHSLVGSLEEDVSSQNSEFLETPEETSAEDSSKNESLAKSLIHSLVGSLEEDVSSQEEEVADNQKSALNNNNDELAEFDKRQQNSGQASPFSGLSMKTEPDSLAALFPMLSFSAPPPPPQNIEFGAEMATPNKPPPIASSHDAMFSAFKDLPNIWNEAPQPQPSLQSNENPVVAEENASQDLSDAGPIADFLEQSQLQELNLEQEEAPKTKTYFVQIPEGVFPGQSVRMEVEEGVLLDLTIPDDKNPGDIWTFDVPVDALSPETASLLEFYEHSDSQITDSADTSSDQPFTSESPDDDKLVVFEHNTTPTFDFAQMLLDAVESAAPIGNAQSAETNVNPFEFQLEDNPKSGGEIDESRTNPDALESNTPIPENVENKLPAEIDESSTNPIEAESFKSETVISDAETLLGSILPDQQGALVDLPSLSSSSIEKHEEYEDLTGPSVFAGTGQEISDTEVTETAPENSVELETAFDEQEQANNKQEEINESIQVLSDLSQAQITSGLTGEASLVEDFQAPSDADDVEVTKNSVAGMDQPVKENSKQLIDQITAAEHTEELQQTEEVFGEAVTTALDPETISTEPELKEEENIVNASEPVGNDLGDMQSRPEEPQAEAKTELQVSNQAKKTDIENDVKETQTQSSPTTSSAYIFAKAHTSSQLPNPILMNSGLPNPVSGASFLLPESYSATSQNAVEHTSVSSPDPEEMEFQLPLSSEYENESVIDPKSSLLSNVKGWFSSALGLSNGQMMLKEQLFAIDPNDEEMTGDENLDGEVAAENEMLLNRVEEKLSQNSRFGTIFTVVPVPVFLILFVFSLVIVNFYYTQIKRKAREEVLPSFESYNMCSSSIRNQYNSLDRT